MKRLCSLLLLTFVSLATYAQHQGADSVIALSNIVIKGFEFNRQLLDAPASISWLNQKAIQRISDISLVPSFNTLAGVRMEERSPGSYRLSIRGSLLRSPFGIRDVKVYLDDIPFTDAGGNTYLNLIDPAVLGAAEILKGPASSLYGAGTGGAVILSVPELLKPLSDNAGVNHFKAQLQGGSNGLLGENLNWQYKTSKYGLQLTQSHLQSDGYRENSQMRKDVIHFADQWVIGKKDELKTQLLLADLFYQTPGGLTLVQWNANPKSARPATATLPSAIQQKAAIYNKTIFSGLSNTYQFSNRFTNVSSLVFNYTDFKNPFITNYEKRQESSRGMRTKFIYKVNLAAMPFKLMVGGEWQTTFAHINDYGNDHGNPDTVQSKDNVNAYQRFYFAQADLDISPKLIWSMGASHNVFTYRYQRISDVPATPQHTKTFDPVVSPRFSLLYKITQQWALRAILSKGFSAPTMAELNPSGGGGFYEHLQAEYGWNYEAGIRADLLKHHLQLDINLYEFDLHNAIISQQTNNGINYFTNAGSTKQQALEAMAAYYLFMAGSQFVKSARLWSSLTLNNYHFTDYKAGSLNYSGNELTGVPREVSVSGFDLVMSKGFYFNGSYNYTSKLPLNDANSFYAKAYHLLQCRIGYKHSFTKVSMELFVGADNLLNEKYSLGNDINAAGNRFYNAAPLRNYFTGISVGF